MAGKPQELASSLAKDIPKEDGQMLAVESIVKEGGERKGRHRKLIRGNCLVLTYFKHIA